MKGKYLTYLNKFLNYFDIIIAIPGISIIVFNHHRILKIKPKSLRHYLWILSRMCGFYREEE